MANERLSKLILMLSSTVDGEVVAAVRAIDRHLKAEKQDWHDLARRLSGPSYASGQSSYRAPPPPPPPRPRVERRKLGPADLGLLRECYRRRDRLSEKELEFVMQLSNRAMKKGDRATVTDPQRTWLQLIAKRLT